MQYQHNRGWVFYNVDIDEFLNFFSSMRFDSTAGDVNPTVYSRYIKDWIEAEDITTPKIHIGIIGWDEKKQDKIKTRKRELSIDRPINIIEMKENARRKLSRFEGTGNPENFNYYQDRFLDKDVEFHKMAKLNKLRHRAIDDGIFILFYKLEPNYVGRFPIRGGKRIYLEEGDRNFNNPSKPLITFLVSTPLGGPSYGAYTNRLVASRIGLRE